MLPDALPGNTMEDSVLARLHYEKLDLPENTTRLRLNSTVINAANVQDGVVVTYLRDGKMHRVRGKNTIMAGYNMMIPYLVPEMPEQQQADLKLNVKAPLVYTNVVVKTGRRSNSLAYMNFILQRHLTAGLSSTIRSVLVGISIRPPRTIRWSFTWSMCRPTRAVTYRPESSSARTSLFAGDHFAAHEEMIRSQLQEMFGSTGFDNQRDISAITVNRWAHGYAYYANSLFDDMDKMPEIIERARQPVGRIAIANSDSDWSAYAHTAIDQAWRAVNELKDMG